MLPFYSFIKDQLINCGHYVKMHVFSAIMIGDSRQHLIEQWYYLIQFWQASCLLIDLHIHVLHDVEDVLQQKRNDIYFWNLVDDGRLKRNWEFKRRVLPTSILYIHDLQVKGYICLQLFRLFSFFVYCCFFSLSPPSAIRLYLHCYGRISMLFCFIASGIFRIWKFDWNWCRQYNVVYWIE